MIPPALAAQLQRWQAQALATPPASGVLAWWGTVALPDGQGLAPCLDALQFDALYGLLQQGALAAANAPAPLPSLVALKAPVAARRPDAEVPVAWVNLPYAAPRPAVLAQVCQAAQAGAALPEPLPPLAAVIEPRRAFLAGALLHEQWGRSVPAHRGLCVQYAFEPAFYVGAAGQPVPEVFAFDAGDGQGLQRVRMGGRVRRRYAPGSTVARCTLQLEAADGLRQAAFELALSAEPAAPVPHESWALQAANGLAGQAQVYLAPGHTRLTHPLILAEGFPGGYAADDLYDMLNQHGCADALRAQGYDVVLLQFGNGLASVVANAQVMQACIQQAMRRTPNPLVVGGVSMGGLVARYALAQMEHAGQPHQSRVLLTIDTPHAGSRTALGVQWFAQRFAPASPTAAGLAFLLASTANQEFVAECLHQGQVGPTPARQACLAAFAAVGQYPQQVRRLAVACGAGDGQPVGTPGAATLRWQGSPFAQAELFALAAGGATAPVARGGALLEDAAIAAELPAASTHPWECAPGGQNTYHLVAAAIARSLGLGGVEVPMPRACTVPTVSALDLADTSPFEPVPPPGSGRSPFHDYVCCESNQLHLQLTANVRPWLLDRLGPPQAYAR